MKSYKEAVELIDAQYKIIDDARNEIARIEKEMLKFSVVKVGDKVTTNGLSHNGKTMVVKNVVVKTDYPHEVIGFLARGPILKKDGEPGVVVGTHFEER